MTKNIQKQMDKFYNRYSTEETQADSISETTEVKSKIGGFLLRSYEKEMNYLDAAHCYAKLCIRGILARLNQITSIALDTSGYILFPVPLRNF